MANVGQVISDLAKSGALAALVQLIAGLLGRRPDNTPLPHPSQGNHPAVPRAADDEFIPPPPPPPNTSPASEIVRLEWHFQNVQAQRKRFEGQRDSEGRVYYGPDNPLGFEPGQVVADFNSGRGAISYGSKAWLDLSGFSAERQLQYADFERLGLQWRSEIYVEFVPQGGGPSSFSFLRGLGELDTDPNNKVMDPATGQYTLPGAKHEISLAGGAVNFGLTKYTETGGFYVPIQFFREGTYTVTVKLGGVTSDPRTVRVS